MSGLKVVSLHKKFLIGEQNHSVLNNLHMEANNNDITVILGKSGCGKTTFLRIIGQLESYDEGSISFNERPRTAFVFQEPRLMPWLTTYQNIIFGLKRGEICSEEIEELIRMVGLEGFQDAYPVQLSGGMQQRVSLARALAYRPSFILMDEPFAALDYFTRKQMQMELVRIQQERKCGMLFVTHSIDEALSIAQKIIILENGSVKKEYQIPENALHRDLLNAAFIERKKDILAQLC